MLPSNSKEVVRSEARDHVPGDAHLGRPRPSRIDPAVGVTLQGEPAAVGGDDPVQDQLPGSRHAVGGHLPDLWGGDRPNQDQIAVVQGRGHAGAADRDVIDGAAEAARHDGRPGAGDDRREKDGERRGTEGTHGYWAAMTRSSSVADTVA
jgi:hypothetical protein